MIGALLLWATENIQTLTVCETTQEASWLPVSSFLVVSTIRGRFQVIRGSFEYTTHSFQKVRLRALSISYELTYKCILEFGEEIMQNELVFCYSFFSQGITEAKEKAKVQSRVKAVYLKRHSLKIKAGFHAHAVNVPWYFIHLFTQPLHPCPDSRWE